MWSQDAVTFRRSLPILLACNSFRSDVPRLKTTTSIIWQNHSKQLDSKHALAMYTYELGSKELFDHSVFIKLAKARSLFLKARCGVVLGLSSVFRPDRSLLVYVNHLVLLATVKISKTSKNYFYPVFQLLAISLKGKVSLKGNLSKVSTMVQLWRLPISV